MRGRWIIRAPKRHSCRTPTLWLRPRARSGSVWACDVCGMLWLVATGYDGFRRWRRV